MRLDYTCQNLLSFAVLDSAASSTLSDDEKEVADDDSDSDEPRRTYAFPELDSQIRSAIKRYEGSVFPKLNFSSPRVRIPP